MLNRKFGALNLWQAALFFLVVLVGFAFLASVVERRMEAKQTKSTGSGHPSNGGSGSNNAGGSPSETETVETKEAQRSYR